MPEHDFLNPYKNQNPGDIKIIDTADKNISAASPAPKKAVSEKVKTETLPASEASTYLFPPLELLNPPYVSKDKHTDGSFAWYRRLNANT